MHVTRTPVTPPNSSIPATRNQQLHTPCLPHFLHDPIVAIDLHISPCRSLPPHCRIPASFAQSQPSSLRIAQTKCRPTPQKRAASSCHPKNATSCSSSPPPPRVTTNSLVLFLVIMGLPSVCSLTTFVLETLPFFTFQFLPSQRTPNVSLLLSTLAPAVALQLSIHFRPLYDHRLPLSPTMPRDPLPARTLIRQPCPSLSYIVD